MSHPDKNQPLRVLHIFAPSYRHRFTGPVIQWRYYFNRWNNPDIIHYVLDTESNKLINGKIVFDFELNSQQTGTPRAARFTWIFALVNGLFTHQGEYDLLHVHVLWWGTLLLGLLPWLKRIPMLYESVLLGEDTPSGLLREKLGKLKLALMRKYAGILAISEVLSEDYTQHGFSQDHVFSLMNSVDTSLFSPSESGEQKRELRLKYGLKPDDQVFLFVGTVNQRKGADILFRAFTDAADQLPSIHLLVVGASNRNENPTLDEDFLKENLGLLEQRDLDKRVTFAGLIQDRQTLADHYRLADAFVFPSRSEGLPTVVLEAMSTGLAVIASALPALEPIINSGENGILCPLEGFNSFTREIIKISTNCDLKTKLGKAARDYILNHHNYEVWQAEISRFYAVVVTEANGNG